MEKRKMIGLSLGLGAAISGIYLENSHAAINATAEVTASLFFSKWIYIYITDENKKVLNPYRLRTLRFLENVCKYNLRIESIC